MNTLRIKLLGGFSVTLGDRPVTEFRSAKARGLLAYLAAEPDRDHLRPKLATLFWGEQGDSAASTNLRNELANLKKLLDAHPALEISRGALRLHSAHADIDVHALAAGIADFGAMPVEAQAQRLHELVATLDLYTGEFLAGFNLNDAVEFDDWQQITREHLHEQVMAALSTLQLRYAELGRWPELASAARRQLALAPWLEAAHRNLMQALAAQGRIQDALEQYARCCAVLEEELGVEPSLATQEIARRLRSGRASTTPPRHNLAQQLKAFVGRTEEIAAIHELVRAKRLVTLLGIGGVGKSHLAQAVAQTALPDFADGVWYVPLANIEAADAAPARVALAINAAMGFHHTDPQAPLAELVVHLANKQALLVLDNWEQILGAAETVLFELLHNTSVHVLATSRVRLQIEGEVSIPLAGLPPAEATSLFLDRARRIVPAFPTQGAVADIEGDILRICEQVAGLPLGIELAASWVEHFSVREIGRSLAEIAISPQQAGKMVSRHHSLSAVFEYSWQLLSPAQQQILARLSIFRGGWDRAAALAVAEAGLSELSALIGHSLVQRVAAGRYNLHPLIQELARNKLSDEQAALLVGKYSHHYLTALMATERTQRAATLQIEFENVRAAWQHAVAASDVAIIERAAAHFGEFITQFGFMADGAKLFADAVMHFDGAPQHQEPVAQLLYRQWTFARAIHGIAAASNLSSRILSLTNNPELRVLTHTDLANHYAEVGAWELADVHFDASEAMLKESHNLAMYIDAVESRTQINALHFRGDYATGIARLQELLTLIEESAQTEDQAIRDVEKTRFRILQSLALVAIRYGDYALAIRCIEQNLAWNDAFAHQQQRGWILLDMALAEQFAGLYPAAIAHNLEALAIAREIGAFEDVGLLQANLCLTMRQSGDWEQALGFGLTAIEVLEEVKWARVLGQARNRVGHTLLTLERWADAYAAYEKALVVWAPLQHPNRYEALAGRAVAAAHLGKQEEALALVAEVLNFTATAGLAGIVEPALLLLNCAAVLNDAGQAEQAQQVLGQTDAWVQMIAGRISDDAIRHAFLHNRPDNQRLNSLLQTVQKQRDTENNTVGHG